MRNQYIAYLFVFLLIFTGSAFADHPETETQTQENWNPPPGIVPDEIEGEEAVCAGGSVQYSCTGTDLDTKKTRSRSRTEQPIYDEECPPNIIAWYWPDWPEWPPWTSVTNADGVHVIKWKASAGSITPGGIFTAPNKGGQYVTITATLDDTAPAVEPPATGSRNDGIAHKTRQVAIIEVESVEADELMVGVGDEVTFTATTDFAGYEDMVTWSGGGEPATDTGPTFTTSWPDPGEYTVTASCGTSSKSINVVVLKVESLLPDNIEREVDDGDGNPDTRTFVVNMATNAGAIVTVTATPAPNIAEANLPASWTLEVTEGTANGSGKLVRTIDRTQASKTVLRCSCGNEKITTVYVVHCTYSGFSDAVLPGHAWWILGIEPSSAVQGVLVTIDPSFDILINKDSGFFPIHEGQLHDVGWVRVSGGSGGHTATGHHDWTIPFQSLINGLTDCKAWKLTPGTYDWDTRNCVYGALRIGGDCGIDMPSFSYPDFFAPWQFADWLNSQL